MVVFLLLHIVLILASYIIYIAFSDRYYIASTPWKKKLALLVKLYESYGQLKTHTTPMVGGSILGGGAYL